MHTYALIKSIEYLYEIGVVICLYKKKTSYIFNKAKVNEVERDPPYAHKETRGEEG